MQASELFALAHSTACVGPHECHWCAAPCKALWIHDEPPVLLFSRPTGKSPARRPGNSYVCAGCLFWSRRSVTVRFLSGRFMDRKTAEDFSWLVTEDGALAVDPADPVDCVKLYEILLAPPFTFALLVKGDGPVALQLGVANDIGELRADTPLAFTVGNVTHSYTVYDLSQTLRNAESGGNEPGVQALVRAFGRPAIFQVKEEKKVRGGQLKKEEEGSGYACRVLATREPRDGAPQRKAA